MPHEIPAELTQREFEVFVTRVADDLSYGEDASSFLGSGIDYAQSRPYVPGDAVRDIDWRVSARATRLFVKEYEALRRVPFLLVVDTSGSMVASSTALSKFDLACVVAGAVGLAALRRQSPVGLLGAGERPLRHRPSLLRNRLFQWLGELRRAEPHEGTYLTERLDEAIHSLRSRSLVVILSDFHDEHAVEATQRVVQRHDCVAIQLQDPAERGALRGGFFRGQEAESARGFVGSGRTRFLGAGIAPDLRAGGVDHLLLSTERPFVSPLRRFLRDRGVLGRNSR